MAAIIITRIKMIMIATKISADLRKSSIVRNYPACFPVKSRVIRQAKQKLQKSCAQKSSSD